MGNIIGCQQEIIIGKQFKKKYKGVKFVTFYDNDEDDVQNDTINFYSYTNSYNFIARARWYRDVIVPDDTIIFKENGFFNANKLNFGTKYPINTFQPLNSHDFLIRAIQSDDNNIKFIKDKNLLSEAINIRPNAVRFIEKQDDNICLVAVTSNGTSLRHIKNQTPTLCYEAVSKTPEAITYVKSQTYLLCHLAVSSAHNALQYIDINKIVLDEEHPTIKQFMDPLIKLAFMSEMFKKIKN